MKEKFEVEIKINFRYGHRLLKDKTSKCFNLHGEGGVATVVLEREKLDEFDEVVDFGNTKKLIKSLIDERYDHAMLLNCDDVDLITYISNMGLKYLILQSDPTAERIAEQIYWDVSSILDEILSTGVVLTRVGVQESFEDSIAWYYGQVKV